MPNEPRERKIVQSPLRVEDIKRLDLPSAVHESALSLFYSLSPAAARAMRKKYVLCYVVFAAFHHANDPRTTEHVAEMFRLKPRVVSKACASMAIAIKQNPGTTPDAVFPQLIITRSVNELLKTYCQRVQVIGEAQLPRVQKILDRLVKRFPDLSSVYPQKLAVGVIVLYLETHAIRIEDKTILGKLGVNEIQPLLRTLRGYMCELDAPSAPVK